MKFSVFNSKVLIFSIIFALFAKSVFAKDSSEQNFPSFEPLFTAEDVFGYTPSDTLSADEVFTLALLFSECSLDSKTAKSCLEKFNQLKKEASSSKFKKMPQDERGKAVLKLLYRDTLKKYDLSQTKIDVAFEKGEYNCVSSAVIYMALAKAAGLDVKGVKTPLHALCTVYITDSNGKKRAIDVETTNPYGFDPGSKETVENENNIKKYYVVPKKNYSNRKEVSDKIFTGLVGRNLFSDYIKSNDYFSAIPLGAALFNLVIDENSEAQKEIRKDFDVLPCNYINSNLKSAHEFAARLKWFTTFIDRWGNTNHIQKNMDSAFHNLSVLCYNENDYPLAEKSFAEFSPYVSKNQLAKTEEVIADLLFNTLIESLNSSEQIEVISTMIDENRFSPVQKKRAEIYLENAWIEIINNHMLKRNFKDGYLDSIKALEKLPQCKNLKNAKQTFYSNCIAQIHNDFAKAANTQKYQEARKILEDGLLEFPNDKTLTKDLNDLNKILKNQNF